MERVDVRGLVWSINRWFLLRGAVAWVITIGAMTLLAFVLLLAASLREYNLLKSHWEVQARQAIEPGWQSQPTVPLPFPTYAERFEVTAKTLGALRIDESLPGKITFAYDRNVEAGLVRQIATMNVDSRWQEIGGLLERAQMTIPTAYISRLHIARDTEQDPVIGAEIHFTLVYRDVTGGGGE